jgi:uncharacterized protein
MNDEDFEIIYSPLEQQFTQDGQSLEICIYKSDGSSWALEIIDAGGTSTVWDEQFDTDQEALDAALRAINEDGIEAFLTPDKDSATS